MFLDDSRILIGAYFPNDIQDRAFVIDVDSSRQLWQLPLSDHLGRMEGGIGRFLIEEFKFTEDSVNSTARVYDADTYEEILTVPADSGARLSPDGKLVAIDTSDGWRFISIDTGADVLNITANTYDEAFSADGRTFVCGLPTGGLATLDLANPPAGAAKSVAIVNPVYAQNVLARDLAPMNDGLLFLDMFDMHRKIWKGDERPVRTLCPSSVRDAVVPVDDSQLWIGEQSGRLRSFDLRTGQFSSPLQRAWRMYPSGLWLLWCIAWFIMRLRHAREGKDTASPQASAANFGGPVLDLSLTLVPLIAYVAVARHVGIWLTESNEAILIALMFAGASAIVLWLGLGRRSFAIRLPCSLAALALFVAALFELLGYDYSRAFGEIESGDFFSDGVALTAAAMTWLVCRHRGGWRFGETQCSIKPHDMTQEHDQHDDRGPKSRRQQWSIRHLLVATAAVAVGCSSSYPRGHQVLFELDLEQPFARAGRRPLHLL